MPIDESTPSDDGAPVKELSTMDSIRKHYDANERMDGVLSQFGFGKKYATADEVTKRGTRAERYAVDEVYTVGKAPTNHEVASMPCVTRTLYSFFQGTMVAAFVATPASALRFAFSSPGEWCIIYVFSFSFCSTLTEYFTNLMLFI